MSIPGAPEETLGDDASGSHTSAEPRAGTVRHASDESRIDLAECDHCDGALWKGPSWDWEHMDNDEAECPA